MNKIQKKLTAKVTEPSDKHILYRVKKEHTFPIYIYDLTMLNPDDYVQLAYEYKEKFPTSRVSTIRGWHTDFETHKNEDDPRLDKLISIIEKKTEEIVNVGFNTNVKAKVFNVWYNILNKGDKIVLHHHLPADTPFCDQYSAVYYPKTTDEMSPIVFENSLKIVPKTNSLMIFPSHITHHVASLETTSDRISIAANMSLHGTDNVDK
jgi:hypothetical protein